MVEALQISGFPLLAFQYIKHLGLHREKAVGANGNVVSDTAHSPKLAASTRRNVGIGEGGQDGAALHAILSLRGGG
ncbi:hypothetical protein [Solirubrum puertoriconensis]|uniref:hypothetical protein n=1 Tax=Solirubrum puertoriconensis TaxID=1751427 RepID=UPI00122E1124|nr:hypothetical protein [Solirubrum puertoriconensis]